MVLVEADAGGEWQVRARRRTNIRPQFRSLIGPDLFRHGLPAGIRGQGFQAPQEQLIAAAGSGTGSRSRNRQHPAFGRVRDQF